MNYLFTSPRLGFRNWIDADIPKMTAVSADPEVMEHFPAPATPEQTEAFIRRMQALYSEKGYCYFAVELLAGNDFVGFIGLNYPTYASPFTPCVDIGWRLGTHAWGKGYATEGAKKCLQFAFETLNLPEVKATATNSNLKSLHVMQKIGMTHFMDFQHPALVNHPHLINCQCYSISKEAWESSGNK